MGKLEESRTEHGKIDLTHVIKPIIECIQKDDKNLLKEHEGKIYVVTDKIISGIIDNKALVDKISREGKLFSDLNYATAIASLHKTPKVATEQMKQIATLEETIYQVLQSQLIGKEADFFGQSASSYFDALTSLTGGKNNEIGTPQSGVFPDAQLSKEYPGTKTILRIPRHMIQMKGDLSEEFVKAVKRAMKKRLSREGWADDEIDDHIETVVDKGLADNTNKLSDVLDVFDKNAYGRIRRTYACSVLEKMADGLENNSPAIPYIRRVIDFNELVQGTLPTKESGLSAKDLVLEFPNADGKGTMPFDLMEEFSQANALDKLPFWFSFTELLSEVTTADSVTTTLGQHFKMNGKVMTEGFNSVFEFHIDKLTTMANLLKEAQTTGQNFPNEFDIQKTLRVAVLYYVVFRDIPPQSKDGSPQYRNAVINYDELKTHLATLVAQQVSLGDILARIAKRLNDEKETTIKNNRAIRQAFKKFLQSRQPEKLLYKQKLYLTVSNDILNDTVGMMAGKPIVLLPSPYDTNYLRFLKVTHYSEADHRALVKTEISFTESLRYLTLPMGNQARRRMNRDSDRNVLGVLFTPIDNEMRYFALPFKKLTNLIIYYERNQINCTNPQSGKDDYRAGLAQLIYVLLVYGVLKAVERLEGEYQQQSLNDDNTIKHANRTMLLMLSLFASSPQVPISDDEIPTSDYVEDRFTHDAHKAIEHLIRQHIPTKSQGFKLLYSKDWDDFVKRSTSQQIKAQATNHIQQEMKKNYRAANIIEGLSSGLDALWHLPDEPCLKKVALIVVTSRACDKTRESSSPGDRKVMFGDIHRFEHETQTDENGEIKHFYRHKPIEAFCDDMDTADSFNNPSIVFKSIRKLSAEGFCEVIIVTKVPFTRRIRMTTDEDTTYTNPTILQELYKEMPDVRIYPLFTQKSYGVRLPPKQPKQPMFIPHDPTYDEPLPDETAQSQLFRAASVLTNKVIEGGGTGDKLHSGITDYLFRLYPQTADIQSEAMAALMSQKQNQVCLHEILRFLHANAFEQSIKSQGTEKPLDAKLDALETIIGDDSVGHQANSLQFPKPKKGRKGPNDKTHYFLINMIALLKHLENQSEQQ